RHVRHPARAGRYRTAQAHQVRGRLSRACRLATGRRGLGSSDAWHPGNAGNHPSSRGRHARCPIQRHQRRRVSDGALAEAGGGLPIGAYGGRREIMGQVAPAGPVYQAGTLSGNPLAVAAGLATLEALDDLVYRQLEAVGGRVAAALASAAAAAGVPLTVNRVGSMLTAFFAAGPITDYATAKQAAAGQF